MENRIGAKEGYNPSTVKYGLWNAYKETYKPPTS